jgi:hypothetical protein
MLWFYFVACFPIALIIGLLLYDFIDARAKRASSHDMSVKKTVYRKAV